MGYNPYICIVCGLIEDNGWGCPIPYYERVEIILCRLGKMRCKYYKEDFGGWDGSTYDVCDKCFRKGNRDEFFNVRHTKSERRDYWNHHCKKR
jgi:hypothetical protein